MMYLCSFTMGSGSAWSRYPEFSEINSPQSKKHPRQTMVVQLAGQLVTVLRVFPVRPVPLVTDDVPDHRPALWIGFVDQLSYHRVPRFRGNQHVRHFLPPEPPPSRAERHQITARIIQSLAVIRVR